MLGNLVKSGEAYVHKDLFTKTVGQMGEGVFTKLFLRPGEVVGIDVGGRLKHRNTIERLLAKGWDYGRQIHEDYYWVPTSAKTFSLIEKINHGYNPNVVMAGDLLFYPLTRIYPESEQLLIDYATFESNPSYRFPCACGTKNCRGEFTGDDWRRWDIRLRYYPDYFTTYLRLKIKAELEAMDLDIKEGRLWRVKKSLGRLTYTEIADPLQFFKKATP